MKRTPFPLVLAVLWASVLCGCPTDGNKTTEEPTVGEPKFGLLNDTYAYATTLKIGTETQGATVDYAVNDTATGASITSGSSTDCATIRVIGDVTVTAYAEKAGYIRSASVTRAMKIGPNVFLNQLAPQMPQVPEILYMSIGVSGKTSTATVCEGNAASLEEGKTYKFLDLMGGSIQCSDGSAITPDSAENTWTITYNNLPIESGGEVRGEGDRYFHFEGSIQDAGQANRGIIYHYLLFVEYTGTDFSIVGEPSATSITFATGGQQVRVYYDPAFGGIKAELVV